VVSLQGQSLQVIDTLTVKTGRYNPSAQLRAGDVFQFTLRDLHGLPVRSEAIGAYGRLEDFRAELHRQIDSSVQPLEMQFIGNKRHLQGSTYIPLRGRERAPRNHNGRVEVIIQLTHEGLHHVAIRHRNTSTLLPWAVAVSGICPADEVVDDDGICYCKPGLSRAQEGEPCVLCSQGKIKEQVGNNACELCEGFGLRDPRRVVTRGQHPIYRDGLEDCGCAPGYMLAFQSLPSTEVTKHCPKSLRPDLWLQHPNISRFQLACCNESSGCSTRGEFSCVEQACREEYLSTIALSIETNSSESAECRECDPRNGYTSHAGHKTQPCHEQDRDDCPTRCDSSFISVRYVPVKPGFWRSNELSTRFFECWPRAACVGSRTDAIESDLHWLSTTNFTENLCRRGHLGPLCSVCVDGYYKTKYGMCERCLTKGYASLLLNLMPQVVFETVFGLMICAVIVLHAVVWCRMFGIRVSFVATTRRIWQLFPARQSSRRLRRLMRFLYQRIPSALAAFKELIHLIHIVAGLVLVFHVPWPENFLQWVDWLYAIVSIDLPFSCVVQLDYGQVLIIKSTAPAVITVLLLAVFGQTSAYWFLFILYPMIISSIFGMFDCAEFDDGTRFLHRDYATSCDTPAYDLYHSYAIVVALAWGLSIPLLGWGLIRSQQPVIDAIQGLEALLAAKGQSSLLGSSKLHARTLRTVAQDMYSAHNRHYGIVFNSSHVHPTIEEAYPLPKLHHWLSEREEEAAFAEFQRQKLARLQQLVRKGFPLDKDDESLRQRLLIGLFPLPAIDELTDLGALEGRSHPLLQQLNLSPLQREWELMTMEERMSHMPPGRRTLPRPGDRLLAINGQLVRQGVRAKSLGGWDHSETLRMLEHVGSTDPQYSTPPRWDERMMATVLSRQLWECEDISRLDVHPLTWTKLESAPTGMRLELGCEGQACLSKALERETSSHPSTTAITLSRKEYLQLGLSNVPGRSHYIELTEVRRGWRYLKPAADSISRASYYVVARVQLPGRKLAESITSRKQYPYLSARVDVDLHLGTSQHLDEQVRDSSHISFGGQRSSALDRARRASDRRHLHAGMAPRHPQASGMRKALISQLFEVLRSVRAQDIRMPYVVVPPGEPLSEPGRESTCGRLMLSRKGKAVQITASGASTTGLEWCVVGHRRRLFWVEFTATPATQHKPEGAPTDALLTAVSDGRRTFSLLELKRFGMKQICHDGLQKALASGKTEFSLSELHRLGVTTELTSRSFAFADGKMFMPIVELPCCVTHYDRYNEQPHAMAGASACERVLHDLALDTLSGVGMIDDKDVRSIAMVNKLLYKAISRTATLHLTLAAECSAPRGGVSTLPEYYADLWQDAFARRRIESYGPHQCMRLWAQDLALWFSPQSGWWLGPKMLIGNDLNSARVDGVGWLNDVNAESPDRSTQPWRFRPPGDGYGLDNPITWPTSNTIRCIVALQRDELPMALRFEGDSADMIDARVVTGQPDALYHIVCEFIVGEETSQEPKIINGKYAWEFAWRHDVRQPMPHPRSSTSVDTTQLEFSRSVRKFELLTSAASKASELPQSAAKAKLLASARTRQQRNIAMFVDQLPPSSVQEQARMNFSFEIEGSVREPLPRPRPHEVTLWLQSEDGVSKMVKLHQGAEAQLLPCVKHMTCSYGLNTQWQSSWEIVELVRKNLLIGVFVIIRPVQQYNGLTDHSQNRLSILMATAVSVFFTVLLLIHKPFYQPELVKLSLLFHFISLVILLFALGLEKHAEALGPNAIITTSNPHLGWALISLLIFAMIANILVVLRPHWSSGLRYVVQGWRSSCRTAFHGYLFSNAARGAVSSRGIGNIGQIYGSSHTIQRDQQARRDLQAQPIQKTLHSVDEQIELHNFKNQHPNLRWIPSEGFCDILKGMDCGRGIAHILNDLISDRGVVSEAGRKLLALRVKHHHVMDELGLSGTLRHQFASLVSDNVFSPEEIMNINRALHASLSDIHDYFTHLLIAARKRSLIELIVSSTCLPAFAASINSRRRKSLDWKGVVHAEHMKEWAHSALDELELVLSCIPNEELQRFVNAIERRDALLAWCRSLDNGPLGCFGITSVLVQRSYALYSVVSCAPDPVHVHFLSRQQHSLAIGPRQAIAIARLRPYVEFQLVRETLHNSVIPPLTWHEMRPILEQLDYIPSAHQGSSDIIPELRRAMIHSCLRGQLEGEPTEWRSVLSSLPNVSFTTLCRACLTCQTQAKEALICTIAKEAGNLDLFLHGARKEHESKLAAHGLPWSSMERALRAMGSIQTIESLFQTELTQQSLKVTEHFRPGGRAWFEFSVAQLHGRLENLAAITDAQRRGQSQIGQSWRQVVRPRAGARELRSEAMQEQLTEGKRVFSLEELRELIGKPLGSRSNIFVATNGMFFSPCTRHCVLARYNLQWLDLLPAVSERLLIRHSPSMESDEFWIRCLITARLKTVLQEIVRLRMRCSAPERQLMRIPREEELPNHPLIEDLTALMSFYGASSSKPHTDHPTALEQRLYVTSTADLANGLNDPESFLDSLIRTHHNEIGRSQVVDSQGAAHFHQV